LNSWLHYGSKYLKTGLTDNIKLKSGQTRLFREEYFTITVPYLKFYGNGNIEKVARLMKLITCIGTRRAIGGGEIHSFKITSTKEDRSIVDHNGYPARPIPVGEIDEQKDWFRTDATYRPPYWDVSKSDICYMPPMERWCPTAVLPFRMLSNHKNRQVKKLAR